VIEDVLIRIVGPSKWGRPSRWKTTFGGKSALGGESRSPPRQKRAGSRSHAATLCQRKSGRFGWARWSKCHRALRVLEPSLDNPPRRPSVAHRHEAALESRDCVCGCGIGRLSHLGNL